MPSPPSDLTQLMKLVISDSLYLMPLFVCFLAAPKSSFPGIILDSTLGPTPKSRPFSLYSFLLNPILARFVELVISPPPRPPLSLSVLVFFFPFTLCFFPALGSWRSNTKLTVPDNAPPSP